MAKQKSPNRNPSSKDVKPSPKSEPSSTRQSAGSPLEMFRRHLPSQAGVRETVESIAVAFILAFLFRTFEAEAFVIPTGSMAPTLMGRHKDITCPVCGYAFQVSASDEVDSTTNVSRGQNHRIVGATCPMCRYTMYMGPDNPQRKSYPSYKGDRILVSKFSYEFAEPQRWDVAVFKYPGGAKTNFIKRLVGLPGETLRISHGDILVRDDKGGDGEFEIARKLPDKLLAMLQPVYDNDFTPTISQYGWPRRWGPIDPAAEAAWQSEDGAAYRTDGAAEGEAWIRYEHRVPTGRDWHRRIRTDVAPPVARQLISDFCGYNTGREADKPGPDLDAFGLHWVGDLAVELAADVQSDTGRLVLELVEGGRRMQCAFDLATGKATLSIDGRSDFGPTAETAVKGPGEHRLRFANIDDQLQLWIDNRLVEFDAPTTYPRLGNTMPTEADLAPVGIATDGAAVNVSHLKVLRDIYYIAMRPGMFENGRPVVITDFPREPAEAYEALSDPERWGMLSGAREVEFTLGEDQFFALGDNSAKSKDGRLWEADGFEHFVHRELLTGKALFIYWPHSWNRIPGTPIPFPMFPNFERMELVR